jgi:delta8-fatty-acid desaturase
MLSAFFLGCFKHQLTFFVHDAGHVGVTGSYFWDRILAIGVADFMGGLSVGWWCDVSCSGGLGTVLTFLAESQRAS